MICYSQVRIDGQRLIRTFLPDKINDASMRVLACKTRYGRGGLGQHFAQLVEESRDEGVLGRYFAYAIRPDDEEVGSVIPKRRIAKWAPRTPLKFWPEWGNFLFDELFDHDVSRRLVAPATSYMGFAGKSLRSFRKASNLGFHRLELVAANSHIRNVERLHERAGQDLGISDSWLNQAQIRKFEREYAMADVIYIHSEYTRQSFLAEGFAPDRLERTVLKVDPRFKPPTESIDDDVFRVVYVGRIDATKGIPLLMEAFSRLSTPKAELTLVGAFTTAVMRRYMEEWRQKDPRIHMMTGDPLEVLQKADVFVHPSYEDGFAYAPMEALACGVPVIVTDETGMKEYVEEGNNGFVVPAGDWEALLHGMESCLRAPMKRTQADESVPAT